MSTFINKNSEIFSAGLAQISTLEHVNSSIPNICNNYMDSKSAEVHGGKHIFQHRKQYQESISDFQCSISQKIPYEPLELNLCKHNYESCNESYLHDKTNDIESVLEKKDLKQDGPMNSRLVVVSNKVRNTASLRHALLPGVNLLQYNCDSHSLDDIEFLIAQICNGQKLQSIAFILSCSGSSLQLVTKDEKFISRDGNLDKMVQEFFMHIVQNHFVSKEPPSRIDLLGWYSLQSTDSYPGVVTELQTLTGVGVGAWQDLSGHPASQKRSEELGLKFSIGELYFRLEKVRNWSGCHQQSLAGFEKIRTVGKGAYGAAVLYKKKDDESLVILKEINMHDLNASERQLALNEVNVLAMLDHPNIISYYDSFEEDGVLMIEMEYADNGTLSQFLAKLDHPLDEKDILTMFQQIVAAIRCIHSHNILHRDLKTDNIFLTKEGVIKIGDFGISKMMGSANKGAQTVLGTPYYISPEMCEGKEYSFKSDIWALGCIIYEITCLQKTFEGSNLPAVVNKIMKGQFAPIKGHYSEEFKELITDMLNKNPNDRPEANDIMYQRLPPLINKFSGKTSDQDDELASSEHLNKKEKIRSVLYYFESSTATLTCINDLPPRMKVKHMAVGLDHVILTTTERQVFSWGDGGLGQLGHDDTKDRYTPTLVEHLKGKSITSVCCGQGFSVFCSDNGLVLTCGDGSKGCLGHGNWCSTTRPRLLESLLSVDVMVIASGLNHVVVIGRDGQVLSWGDGSYGQLGHGSEEKLCLPNAVHIAESVIFKDVQCGIDGTMLISDVGGVFACGNNENNKLGLNNRQGFLMAMKNIFTKTEVEGRNIPTPVRALARHRVLAVSMGVHHTAVIVEHGHVITFGKNTNGQLGTQNTKLSSTPVELKALDGKIVNRIQCGVHYTVASTKDHELYYWGLRYTVPLLTRLEDTTGQQNYTAPSCHTGHRNDHSMVSKLSPVDTALLAKNGNVQANNNVKRDTNDSSQSYTQYDTDPQSFKPLSRVPKRSLSTSSQENMKDRDKEVIKDGSVLVLYPMEIIKLKQGNEKMLLGNIYCHGENLFIQVETTAPPPRRRAFKKRVMRHKSNQSSALATSSNSQICKHVSGGNENSCSSETSEMDSHTAIPTWLKEELAQSFQDFNDGNEPDDTSGQSEEDRRTGGIDSSMSSIQINRALTPVAGDNSYAPCFEVQTFISGDKCSPRQNDTSHRAHSVKSCVNNAELFSDSSSGEPANFKHINNNIMPELSLTASLAAMSSRQKSGSVKTDTQQIGPGREYGHQLVSKEKLQSRNIISNAAIKRREELLLLDLESIKEKKKDADTRIKILEKEREDYKILLKHEVDKLAQEREKALMAEVEKLHLQIESQHSLLEFQQTIVGELQEQLKQVMAEQVHLRNEASQLKLENPCDNSVSLFHSNTEFKSTATSRQISSISKICTIQ